MGNNHEKIKKAETILLFFYFKNPKREEGFLPYQLLIKALQLT